MYHIADGMWISLLGDHGVRAIEQSAHRRPRATALPGSDERLVRHDLARVRDEPEQGRGLWIGIKVCKTGAGNSLDDTGNVRLRSGNSQGEPGNTPDDPGNTSSAPSHTPTA